jgi:putative phosphoribosyl transferase
VRVLNPTVVSALGIPEEAIEHVAARETAELERRLHLYRGDRPFPSLTDKVVIVVDDGLATGATMRAAVAALRAHRPRRVVVAVPVGAGPTCEDLAGDADEVVCARMPAAFQAVGQWYRDFSPTTDEEIRRLLDEWELRRPTASPPARGESAACDEELDGR